MSDSLIFVSLFLSFLVRFLWLDSSKFIDVEGVRKICGTAGKETRIISSEQIYFGQFFKNLILFLRCVCFIRSRIKNGQAFETL